MTWWVTGAMAVAGALSANSQAKQAQSNNKAAAQSAAAQTANSPWTNMGAGTVGPMQSEGGGAVLGGLQGGLSGYSMAKANPDMFGGGSKAPAGDASGMAPEAAMAPTGTGQANYAEELRMNSPRYATKPKYPGY